MDNTMVGVLRVLLYTPLILVLFAYVPSGLSSERDIRNSIALGAMAFSENCQRCHQADGYGEEALYPSLHPSLHPSLQSEELLADRSLLIRTILDGRSRHQAGSADGAAPLMPSLDYLTDKEIVSIIAFISNTWGNDVLIVSESEVAAAR